MRVPVRVYAPLSGLIIAVVLPVIGMAVVRRYAPSASLVNIPLHSLLETMGGMMALTIAGTLVAKQHRALTEPHWTWTACALAGMGTLDLFHAALPSANAFVWLHSMATFVGGVFFLGVWVGRPFSPQWARWLPAAVFSAAFVLGVVFCTLARAGADHARSRAGLPSLRAY